MLGTRDITKRSYQEETGKKQDSKKDESKKAIKNCPNSPKFLPAKIEFLGHSPMLILAKFNFLQLEFPFLQRTTFFPHFFSHWGDYHLRGVLLS